MEVTRGYCYSLHFPCELKEALMKNIKTTIVLVLAIAAMAAGVWGDRNLDARYSAENMTPETVVDMAVA